MRKALAFTTLLGALAISTPVNAATLVLDGGWQSFSFGGAGSAIQDDGTLDTSYTFSLTGPATLKVTDAYLDGDQFNIIINGTSYGTSTPTNDGISRGGDFDAAFADPRFSHGAFSLGTGTYTVTGTVILSPYDGGGGAIELVSAAAAVPEPATWAMMLLGFGMVGVGLRGRRARSVRVAYC